ncbi:MAG TPA: RNA polymerase factor sigma-54 [Phycisphaerales bacterium]|nr:RNA polymerase factor sigma-54 [Phycisphaerales bacterium]
MRFDATQQMRLGQHMKLAPRMIQSMEILQMPVMELEERIGQELESNVALEVNEDEPEGYVAEAPEPGGVELDERPLEAGSAPEDFERLESFELDNPDAFADEPSEAPQPERERLDWLDTPRARMDSGEPDAKSEAMANTAARSASLQEQLLDQWRLAEVDPALRPLGEQIIASLEDDGYLRTPLEVIAERLPPGVPRPEPAQMELALKAVQLLLEPPGVAARDVRECLLLQIDAALAREPGDDGAWPGGAGGDWTLVRALVADHLEDLAQNRLPRVAERAGVSLGRIKQAMEQMRGLSLAPARRLIQERQGVIVPDAIVEYDQEQDRYIAYLNDRRLPNLRLNQEYALMARDREVPKPTRDFLKKNMANAAWLIDALEQRKRTVLRVVSVVVQAQRDFFDYGPAHLRPLPMTQVAEQLGVHVATVSRAVADKYIQTPRGILPLRMFFTGGTQTESGEDVSWDAIKAALKEVVEAEDKSNPLSDEALADELKKRGIEIARRTVAKYRDQLGVPSARLRKQY